MARVLGALRQSKTKERAVSIPAQKKAIQRWADENGHEVVAWTEDASKSGGLSPFKRPKLGPFLTNPIYIAAWDILVTLKLDRINRSTKDFLMTMEWCSDHGKSYVSLKENIDMSTAQGRQAARDMASRAEWERDMASERRLETLAELAEDGRYGGGTVAYGWHAVERDDGFYVEPDYKATTRIARLMAFHAIDGRSNPWIKRWLKAQGIPSPAGNPEWRTERVRLTLINPAMEALLSPRAYLELRDAMQSRQQNRGQWTGGEHMLLRVGFCGRCTTPDKDVPMYGNKKKYRDDVYRCQVCHLSVAKTEVEAKVVAKLKANWLDQNYTIPVIVSIDDRTTKIKLLEGVLKTARSLPMVDTGKLEEEIAKLRASKPKPDEIKPHDTGKTISRTWDELETISARNEFLRFNRVRAIVGPDGDVYVEPTFGPQLVDFS